MEDGFDRVAALKEFDDLKSGVKGLVDSGVVKIPNIFIYPTEERPNKHSETGHVLASLQVPTIDLHGVDGRGRKEIVDKIRQAAESWGFFLIVNHKIPIGVLDEMISSVRQFHEQPDELKMELYNRDPTKRVMYFSNHDLFQSSAASWRDSFNCYFDLGKIDAQDIPQICREAVLEYVDQVDKLGKTMAELISESLGLERSYLKEMNCVDGIAMATHYYPPCPEPELTYGICAHTDASFMTILLQDQVGGLQVLHKDAWVDVTPVHGSLLVNIGDLLQCFLQQTELMSNEKYKSIKHRVPASGHGPRVSVASFFNPKRAEKRIYGPIKELLSESNRAKYRETTVGGIVSYFFSKGLEDYSISHFRV